MSNTGLYESDSEPEGSRYNDSDEESLVDVDSPTDGYFERREHPQTTFVPNPATQGGSEEDKAREAAAERREQQQQRQREQTSSSFDGATRRVSPPSHGGSQPRSPVWAADEHTPLLDAGPAGPPPDYAAATADRTHGRERSYGSLSDSAFPSDHPLVRNGLLNEQGVFGRRSEPQSMGDLSPPPHAAHRSSLRGGGGENEGERAGHGDEERGFVRGSGDRDWNGRKLWRKKLKKFKAKRLFTWLAVFGILMFILLVSGFLDDAQWNGGYPSGGNGRNRPGKSPTVPGPDDGDGDDDGGGGLPEGSPMPPHISTPDCHFHSFSSPSKFTFAHPNNFTFLELIEHPSERALFNDRITGTVQITPAPADQAAAIVVWVSVAVSGPFEIERLRSIMDKEGMELLFPSIRSGSGGDGGVRQGHKWTGAEGSCMDFSLGMFVRPGTKLEGLDISSANLNVTVERGVFDQEPNSEDDAAHHEGVTLTVPAFEDVDSATLTLVRGVLNATYFSARRTYIETTSSSISGTYALRDLLAVKSSSGQISIAVDPKNASATNPLPADFHASSNSGSIDVRFPTDSFGRKNDIPERDYRTRVESSSSQIKGSYIFSSDARFTTNSGALHLDVLPYYADAHATLRTSSGSAQTRLRLLEPYNTTSLLAPVPVPGREGLLNHLTSSHKSVSGSLHITYPDAWQGIIDGESVSGSIVVRGEDVEVLISEDIGKGIPGRSMLKHITARKGYGESKLGFVTTSGSVDVLVGNP